MASTFTVFGGETMISRALDNPEPNDARELTTNELDAISGGFALLPFLAGMAVGVTAVAVGALAADGAFDAIDFSRLRECA